MNAIIVDYNGKPSMMDLVTLYPFDQEVFLFSHHIRRGKSQWKRYSSKTGVEYTSIDGLPKFNEGDTVVRWGTRINISSKGAIVYNKASQIKKASNKRIARDIFDEKNIDTPKRITLNTLHETTYPIVIRDETHHGGQGFYVSHTDEETFKILAGIEGRYYMSEVYPKTAEYRVHCAHGKVLLIKRKPEPEDKKMIAWNWAQNHLPWSIVDRKDHDYDMCKLALKAMDAVELDFGAVDIMSYPMDGFKGPQHVVCEVNTAPSHTPYLREKYGAYFNLLFNTVGEMKHWDYNKYEKATSFVWKNKQLKNKK